MERAAIISTRGRTDGPAIFRREGANEPAMPVCIEIAIQAVSKQEVARVARLIRETLTPDEIALARAGAAGLLGDNRG